MDEGGEECGGVVADREGTAVVGVSAGFGDGDAGGFFGAGGGDARDEAEVDEFVEGEVVCLGEAGEDVEGETFVAGFGGDAGDGVEEVVGGVWVGVGVGWVDGVVGGGGWLVVEGPGEGVGGGGEVEEVFEVVVGVDDVLDLFRGADVADAGEVGFEVLEGEVAVGV